MIATCSSPAWPEAAMYIGLAWAVAIAYAAYRFTGGGDPDKKE